MGNHSDFLAQQNEQKNTIILALNGQIAAQRGVINLIWHRLKAEDKEELLKMMKPNQRLIIEESTDKTDMKHISTLPVIE